MTSFWHRVATELNRKLAAMDAAQELGSPVRVNRGQRDSLRALARRLPRNGAIVADEVGMGKTRIATELTQTVVGCDGRVAILAPAGLGFQWKRELAVSQVAVNEVMRSVVGFGQGLVDDDAGLAHWAQQVMLLSHAFGKWRIREAADPVRWCLLPAVVAVWHELRDPAAARRRASRVKALGDQGERALAAARALAREPNTREWPWREPFAEFCAQVSWESLLRPGDYAANSEHRTWLHRVIGLCLGRFDLVVIDEAHKSRGDDSSLSVMLDEVLWLAPSARHVAMTATPVELDAQQWLQTLGRIGVRASEEGDESPVPRIERAINAYAQALRNLRAQWRSNEVARTEFAAAAKQFQEALGTYVLRRDKRSDEAVRLFADHGGDQYRDTGQAVVIDTDSLHLTWKHALCAAEALSVIHVPADQATKRLRLTFASGHGSSSFMDGRGARPPSADGEEDVNVPEGPQAAVAAPAESHAPASGQRDASAKRKDRLDWWRARLEAALRQVPNSRFGHPAVMACVRAIEARTERGDKVLVFGTYTEPMNTLVHLLNARQMLRSLLGGKYWPQSSLGTASETGGATFRGAVDLAYQQWPDEHDRPYPIPRDSLEGALEEQFDAEHRRREGFRKALVARLHEGLAAAEFAQGAGPRHVYLAVLSALRDSGAGDVAGMASPIALVARALLDQTGGKAPECPPAELALEFVALVDATLDQDLQEATDAENAAESDPADAQLSDDTRRWSLFCERLAADASAQMGGFARLMYGGTSADSRRRIQQSFNRLQAYPMVVVAQSRVGREGLNLHEACSVVLLMHPEWNPAVVEQQIGRVDRVNSLWSARLKAAIQSTHRDAPLPRIEVMPVVFRGTYDEHQWAVLNERWADLRAQLHGEVIPTALRPPNPTEGERDAMQFLERVAPRFSP